MLAMDESLPEVSAVSKRYTTYGHKTVQHKGEELGIGNEDRWCWRCLCLYLFFAIVNDVIVMVVDRFKLKCWCDVSCRMPTKNGLDRFFHEKWGYVALTK